MGLFSQREDEENTWAALPGEPHGQQDAADVLEAPPEVDPLNVGLGAQYTSVAFPVAPPAPEVAEASGAAPKDPDPHVLGPGLLPTPFTSYEIRDASRGGKTIRIVVEEPDGTTIHRVNRFRDLDDEGATLERWTSGPTGIVQGEIERSRVTWRELQGHAAFPADLTTLSSETLELPIGRVDCLRYEMHESADADVFWFAVKHPGMPVRFESLTGAGVQRTTVVKIERP